MIERYQSLFTSSFTTDSNATEGVGVHSRHNGGDV